MFVKILTSRVNLYRLFLYTCRISYRSTHVLLNLLNEMRKKDKMLGKASHLIVSFFRNEFNIFNQRTNGPVNAHLISWPTKAQNIQNLENI